MPGKLISPYYSRLSLVISYKTPRLKRQANLIHLKLKVTVQALILFLWKKIYSTHFECMVCKEHF
jgi:hypothetical protein